MTCININAINADLQAMRNDILQINYYMEINNMQHLTNERLWIIIKQMLRNV